MKKNNNIINNIILNREIDSILNNVLMHDFMPNLPSYVVPKISELLNYNSFMQLSNEVFSVTNEF
jgi:hypothetical protein